MKMKKIYTFLLLFTFFLCTGCSSIKYSLKFDNVISENVSAEIVFNNNYLDEEVGFYFSPFRRIFGNLPYDIEENDNGSSTASSYFETMDDFINNSAVFNTIFDKSIINVDQQIVNIKIVASDYDNIKDQIDGFPVEISLYIPYHVMSNNATRVSKNTYTWIINDLEKDTINISFDMSKAYNYRNKIIEICTIIGFSIIILIIIIYLVIRNKKANEI